MNVGEFELNHVYEGAPKSKSYFIQFIPIEINEPEDSIIVLIVYDEDQENFDFTYRWVQTIKDLQEESWEALCNIIKYPNADHGVIHSRHVKFLAKWDCVKGKYITDKDEVLTSITTLKPWQESKKAREESKPDEATEEHEEYPRRLDDLTILQQALVRKFYQEDRLGMSCIEYIKEIQHAVVDSDEDIVTVRFYSGMGYEINNEELVEHGYTYKDAAQLYTGDYIIEKVKAAYSYGIATISGATVSDIPNLLEDSDSGEESCAREILDWYNMGNPKKGVKTWVKAKSRRN